MTVLEGVAGHCSTLADRHPLSVKPFRKGPRRDGTGEPVDQKGLRTTKITKDTKQKDGRAIMPRPGARLLLCRSPMG